MSTAFGVGSCVDLTVSFICNLLQGYGIENILNGIDISREFLSGIDISREWALAEELEVVQTPLFS